MATIGERIERTARRAHAVEGAGAWDSMGLFGKKMPEQVQVAGLDLRCEICKHDRFWKREAQLNTAVATFFNLDWANPTALCYVCDGCGYIHWFMPQR